ncbi:IS701 family transposase [Pseudonocardia aurantiaca]|uniref:IS701 family transposase n=1 Tax=Pseudonocardia aurantiaca TaxID=75290 RepID=A0ABW4FKE3_9PSEU
MGDADLEAWAGGLDGLFARVAGRFFRAEPRRRARAYVRGLLAPLAGKNGWTLAEVAGDATPDGMQRLLNAASWDADGVRDDVRGYVVEHLGEPGGVLIVDETGFLKKGVKSAGVQRQYSGTFGRIENCQLGVFLAYATSKGRTLIDRELYLPKTWIGDRDRCREAAVPDEIGFSTQAVLGEEMLGRALDAGVPASWVAADEAYGQNRKFRIWCERRRVGYVVAVPPSQTIPSQTIPAGAGSSRAGSSRADSAAAAAPDQAWKRLSCAEGAKGPRLFDWAVASVSVGEHTPPGWGRWLLVRRQILSPDQLDAGKQPELAYYLCAGPPGTSDDELIHVAGTRWAIEECFQTAKSEVGLDQYQVRRYDAWYRHITLAMLAHTYLSVTAAIAPKALAAASSGAPSARSAVSWHT